jgi:hypothetical protein
MRTVVRTRAREGPNYMHAPNNDRFVLFSTSAALFHPDAVWLIHRILIGPSRFALPFFLHGEKIETSPAFG